MRRQRMIAAIQQRCRRLCFGNLVHQCWRATGPRPPEGRRRCRAASTYARAQPYTTHGWRDLSRKHPTAQSPPRSPCTRHSTPPPLTQYHILITYPATVDPAGYMQSAMASWVRGDCLRSLGPAGSSPRPWHSLAPTVPVVRGEAGARLRSASLRLRWNHPARLPRGSPRQCVDSQNPAFLPVGGFGEWRPRHTRCTRAPCARECHGRRRAGGYHPPTPVPQVLTYFHVFGPRDSVPASQVAGSVDSAPASPPPPEVSGDGGRLRLE